MKKLIVMLVILGFGAGSVIAQDAPKHDDNKDHNEKKHHHHHHDHDHHDDHKGGDKK
jgi:hypothetical protein